ncbi:hypothetical protein LR48_Vigan02g123000 [Vigna angularis]|uniref:Uncharacterized protein n=1 Tax=Phaseolus angularis TaxID=3914 RepID=A0A0L9TX15_PHAAN|nr:hypothetical protein LR48_Vigan02g123000 [Vigna angularis]
MMVENEGNHAPEFRLLSLDRCEDSGDRITIGGGLASSSRRGAGVFACGENVGRTRDSVPAICSSLYSGCHGSVIWLPEKMKDGIPGAMFGDGSAFGPFHVFYEMR